MRKTTRITCLQGLHRAFLPVAAVAILTGCIPEPEQIELPPSLVPAIRIAGADALTERNLPGRARAGQEVNLSFRVTGPLIDLPVSVGDEIEEGQVVARIDPADYVNALGSVDGQLMQATAVAARAEADFNRIQNVYNEDPGATSKSALDLARSAKDASAAAVKSMKSALKIAQDKVYYTSLTAPFGGVVVETYVENFETVLPKQPVLRLLDPSSIEFVVSVPESMISYTPYVKEISVVFDALPGITVAAEIKEIGREASSATRTYPVTLVMSQPETGEILPGMAGSAKVHSMLPVDARETGIEIPATAVFTMDDPSKSYVWIVDTTTNTLASREVDPGRLTVKGVLIRSGLTAGDWVVIKGVNSVSEGQKVRVQDLSGEGSAS
ncbi:MAG: efflux RND transporter periplasmic adaptor subunit [Halioglobus sp.]